MLLATISELSKNGINIVQIKNKKTKTIIKREENSIWFSRAKSL